jgi:hypothetical protein
MVQKSVIAAKKAHFREDHGAFKKVMREAEQLRYKKLCDYGKTYDAYGLIGILVKIEDKSSRIKNCYENKSQYHESMRDSLIDLANYAIMGVMVLDEDKRNIRRPHK